MVNDSSKPLGSKPLGSKPLYGSNALPPEIRSRRIEGVNGMTMHILEAGSSDTSRPLVLLLHGFPELAFSFRHQLLPLAEAGFHVVAPDQRGYGRTTGWNTGFDGDVSQFRMLNLVEDTNALVEALGYETAYAVVGHDFGSPVAAWCALTRPDVFARVAMMSAPFRGAPSVVKNPVSIPRTLAGFDPPRKHYQWYYSGREANSEMANPPQGLHKFMRGYYHVKSADYRKNKPSPITSIDDFARLPHYYVMLLNMTMSETIAQMIDVARLPSCDWLSDNDLSVYVEEYRRTGFQGGLNWYRCSTNLALTEGQREDQYAYTGRTIDVPSIFIAGKSDWGIYQTPYGLSGMQSVCTSLREVQLIDDAGHWVQQEQPQKTTEALLNFLLGT